jgi:CBS domain-containing protein
LVHCSTRWSNRDAARVARLHPFRTIDAFPPTLIPVIDPSVTGLELRTTSHADRVPQTRYMISFRDVEGGSPMKSVASILKAKADHTIYTIAPTASVFEAINLMADKRIGALVVLEDGQIVGIVTERDYARKIALKSRASRKTPVRDIMSTSVIHVSPQHTSEDCMVLMARNHLRHLPVIDRGKLVGMISIRDLVNEIIANL